jgi:hypothetical protein
VLYRLLRQVAQALPGELDRVQVCGVLPQLPGVLSILLGMGYRAFSVDAGVIPYLAHRVRQTSVAEAQELAADVCSARESRQVAKTIGVAGSDFIPCLLGDSRSRLTGWPVRWAIVHPGVICSCYRNVEESTAGFVASPPTNGETSISPTASISSG